MSVITLNANGLADYRYFVRTFFRVADDRARQFINRKLVEQPPTLPGVHG